MPRLRRRRLPPSIRIRQRWPRRVALVIIVVATALAVLRDRTIREPKRTAVPVAPSQQDDFERYHDRSFRVAYVVDGDTLRIDAPDGDKPQTRIRLWGVDTPEIARGGQPDMHFGPESTQYARNTLDDRTVHIVLSPLNTRDRYNRLLAYVFLERGGEMFNELLIEKGYGYADPRWDHHYRDQFQAAERRARRAGVGLWKEVTLDDMPPWRRRIEARSTRTPDDEPADMAAGP